MCDKYRNEESYVASRRMFDAVGIKYEKMKEMYVTIK